MFLCNTNGLYTIMFANLAVNHAAGNRQPSIARADEIALPSQVGVLGQLVKCCIELPQILVTLTITISIKPFASLTRTPSTPRPFAHGFAMTAQTALRAGRVGLKRKGTKPAKESLIKSRSHGIIGEPT